MGSKRKSLVSQVSARSARWLPWGVGVAVVVLGLAWPGPSASQDAEDDSELDDEELPGRVVIDIDSPERDLYRIAIPDLRGLAQHGDAAEVVRNDLRLVSLFRVLDARSFIADLEAEGLSISPSAWDVVGAQGVVKGKVSKAGEALQVEMRLFEVARGSEPVLSKSYRGGEGELRGFMHDFANEVLRVLTGEAGAFGTRIAYARRVGAGRKDVFVADFDGSNPRKISRGKGIAMLPSFGEPGIWYSVLTPKSMFITHSGAGERPVIGDVGLNMGVTVCEGRLVFSSNRHGNSEIYSANLEGGDIRRLTNHPAIDVSPACGPGGKIAFVSARHGGPQIFVMDGDGGNVERVTYRGSYNQTPAWCPDPEKELIAFTGRDGAMDVFTVDLKTESYTRLTQGQGNNFDPAFSPDCRMVAFASSRGGIYVSNPEGLNQQRILSGDVESVRWSRR